LLYYFDKLGEQRHNHISNSRASNDLIMNLVTLEKISKHFSERPLLEEASLLINDNDRIGLIGPNGSGKTTLLRLIAGLEPPENGQVIVWGGVRIQYLAQEPELNDALTVLDQLFQSDSPQLQRLAAYRQAARQLERDPENKTWQTRLTDLANELEHTGGWAAEANAKAILTQLGMADFDVLVGSLSGGQRKRVALARALLDPADLLILDEPTNHIDADAINWLEEYLLGLPAALLMVTHDRYFLDRVANRIVEIDRRELVSYPGNYSAYLTLRAERQERLTAAETKRQALLRRELEWLRRGAMARSTKQKARKQRIEEMQQIGQDRGDQTVAMALAGRRLGKRVLEATNISKAFGDNVLFQNIDFSLTPGERIGIIGPNGVGKSSFLDILAGHLAPDSGQVTWGETVRLAYYDQLSRDLPLERRVIDFINEKAPLIRTNDGRRLEAAQMLEWFLFPRPQQQALIGSLSGGERRRLYLLYALVLQPNVLLLDEPTNDLDIQTLTALEEFLDHFQGCLLAVSHDRYFLDRTVDYLAVFEDGRFSPRYPAPYENYRRLREEQAAAAVAAAPSPIKAARTAVVANRSSLTWKESRELETLERTIAALEEKRDVVQTAINNSGANYQQLNQLAEKLAQLEGELDTAVNRWLELEERRNLNQS
jgi:ABC transport system ATP-binding/permease protein